MPRKAPLPGDPNYRPAGGKGWGGPAKGKGAAPLFTSDAQPSPDAKVAGREARAAMRERLEEVRMEVAETYIEALRNGDPAQKLAAADKILDRLDGKPPQAITGADGGPQVTRMVYEWADKPGD